MDLNQMKAPIPKRAPKFVAPKSPAPWDIATAITTMEHDAYAALVKEPAEAAGITPLPELPGPGTFASMLIAPLQNLFGGLTKQGGGQGNQTKRGTAGVEEQPPTPTRERHRGTL